MPSRHLLSLQPEEFKKCPGRLADLMIFNGTLIDYPESPRERAESDKDGGQPGDTRSTHLGDSPVRRRGDLAIGIFKQGSPRRTRLDPVSVVV